MISVDHLQKRFATVHAVDDVSLQALPGEIFGLLGPNGAGKSTTIRMIVNIIRPDSGEILYDDDVYSDDVRSKLGYLSEERGLYQKARILETIIHFATLRGMSDGEAKDSALVWLKRFDLELNAHKRRVEELSKGNQQKLQLIIALIHRPKFIMLDEPSSGLDPVNQELLRDILDELRRDGRTIFYSTHQMEAAERICNRIALIDRGRLVLSGTIDEVRARHGRNTVRIEFAGNPQALSSLPLVVHANIYPNFAELQLTNDASVNDLLPHLSNLNLRITKIESVRPSLNTIFLQTVGRATVSPVAAEVPA